MNQTVRGKRFTARYYTYLSPTEDVDVIDYIDSMYGNGNAEKLRNALRALFAEHQHAAGNRRVDV